LIKIGREIGALLWTEAKSEQNRK